MKELALLAAVVLHPLVAIRLLPLHPPLLRHPLLVGGRHLVAIRLLPLLVLVVLLQRRVVWNNWKLVYKLIQRPPLANKDFGDEQDGELLCRFSVHGKNNIGRGGKQTGEVGFSKMVKDFTTCQPTGRLAERFTRKGFKDFCRKKGIDYDALRSCVGSTNGCECAIHTRSDLGTIDESRRYIQARA